MLPNTFVLDVREEVSTLAELAHDVNIVDCLAQIQRLYDGFVRDDFVTLHFVMEQHIVYFIGYAAPVDYLDGNWAVSS